MPIWLLIFILVLGGWLTWEAWRGLARGEMWNFNTYVWPREHIKRATRPILFWVVWAIVASSAAYLVIFTLAWTFAFGVAPLGD